MPRIHYLTDDKVVETNSSRTILDSSLKSGIQHVHVCGGYARCSTCRVLVLKGLENCRERNNLERTLADRLNFSPNIRLACQTTLNGDITVRRLVLDAEDITLTSQLQNGAPRQTFVGQEQEVAILFADIRGFTTFAESQLPYDVVHALNRYFFEMGEVISRNGGYIDNYMGDGLMALFGVDEGTDAPLRAVKAGYEMVQAMEHLKPYMMATYKTELEIGVGIHYGTVVVGSIGSASHKKITAIGDAVNLASRIESANKEVKTRLLISEDVHHYVQDVVTTGKEASIMLKGKSGEYRLFEVANVSEVPIRLPEKPIDPNTLLSLSNRAEAKTDEPPAKPPVLEELGSWMMVAALAWGLVGAGFGLWLGLQTGPMMALLGLVLGAAIGAASGVGIGAAGGALLEWAWRLTDSRLQTKTARAISAQPNKF